MRRYTGPVLFADRALVVAPPGFLAEERFTETAWVEARFAGLFASLVLSVLALLRFCASCSFAGSVAAM